MEIKKTVTAFTIWMLLTMLLTSCGNQHLDANPPKVSCTVHGYIVNETIPSTCTEAGKAIKTCFRCGIVTEESLPLGRHNWEVLDEALPCIRCIDCKAEFDYITEEIKPHIHQYETTVIDSTCQKQGQKVETCVCGDTKTTKLPLSDHKPSDKVEGKDTLCTVCGKVLAKATHIHKYVVTTIASTCNVKGKTVEKCDCGDIKSENELPLADHTPSAKVDGKDTVCTVCGKVLATASHTHKYEIKKTESTCTKQGEEKEVCACGDVKSTKTLPLADHKPSVTDCEKDTICTDCGKVLTPKTGHKFGAYSAVTQATCTSKGTEKATCTVCGKIDEREIAMTEHTPSAKVDGKDTVCTVCGKVLEAHVHTYKTKKTPSTCVKQGKTEEVCACGDAKSTKILPLAEHTPSAKVTGKDTVCTVCGVVLEQGIKPTTGANLTAGEVYQNAYYNTNQLGSYSTKYSVTIDKKVLLGFAAVGATISGNLKTVNEETTGTTKIALSGDSLDCVYEYPIMSKTGKRFARLTLSNGKYLYVPFDLADTNTGIVVPLPESALSKMTFDKSSSTKVICSLTNSEAWSSYKAVLDYLVEFAGDQELDLTDLTFSEVTLTAYIDNDVISNVEVGLVGKAKSGKIEIGLSVSISET